MEPTYIDPALARGLARSAARTSRTAFDEREAVLHRALAGPRPAGRAARYRWLLNTYRLAFKHAITVDRALGSAVGKKADEHLFLLWDSLADSLRMALAAILVRARRFDQLEHTLLVVSQHACERIFQRIGTTDASAVRAELDGATKTVCSLWAALPFLLELVPDFSTRGILIPTLNGALVAVKPADEQNFVATTWLSNDLLRPDQAAAIASFRSDNPTYLIEAGSPIPLPADPYPFMTLVLASARCRSILGPMG